MKNKNRGLERKIKGGRRKKVRRVGNRLEED